MKALIALAASAALFPATAQAAPVYLDCTLTSAPDYQRFRTKEHRDAFIQGIWARGQMSYIVPPSKTWMIDIEARSVMDLEDEATKNSIKGAKISEGMVVGQDGYGDRFEFNRISGRLTFTKYSSGSNFVVEEIVVPTSATWTFQCTASKRRVL